jgi:DNA-binding transcriptional ArsR family regulator
VSRLSTEGPLSIAQLTAGTEVSRQAVSKHLLVLAQAGLAHGIHRGRERIWELESQPLLTAHEFLEHMSEQWDDALARLTDIVERPQAVRERNR